LGAGFWVLVLSMTMGCGGVGVCCGGYSGGGVVGVADTALPVTEPGPALSSLVETIIKLLVRVSRLVSFSNPRIKLTISQKRDNLFPKKSSHTNR